MENVHSGAVLMENVHKGAVQKGNVQKENEEIIIQGNGKCAQGRCTQEKEEKKEYAKEMYTRKIYVCVWKGHGCRIAGREKTKCTGSAFHFR